MIYTAKKCTTCFNVDENVIEKCLLHCSQLSTIFFIIVTPDSKLTVLLNIFDDHEKHAKHIVHCYTAGSRFFATTETTKE